MEFVIVGILGVAVLLAALIFDDFLDGLTDGFASTEVVGAFLAAFGFGTWMIAQGTGAGTGLAMLGGLGAGVAMGWGAFRLSKALYGMHTDASPMSGDLMGREGRVVTPIEATSSGEIIVQLGGQPIKLTAISETDIGRGETVLVVQVLSSTRVRVEPSAQFWNRELSSPPIEGND